MSDEVREVAQKAKIIDAVKRCSYEIAHSTISYVLEYPDFSEDDEKFINDLSQNFADICLIQMESITATDELIHLIKEDSFQHARKARNTMNLLNLNDATLEVFKRFYEIDQTVMLDFFHEVRSKMDNAFNIDKNDKEVNYFQSMYLAIFNIFNDQKPLREHLRFASKHELVDYSDGDAARIPVKNVFP